MEINNPGVEIARVRYIGTKKAGHENQPRRKGYGLGLRKFAYFNEVKPGDSAKLT
jgi:hypothetical protein